MTAADTTISIELTAVPEAATTSIALSATAAVKIRALLVQDGRDDLRLRVAVQPGGCSGLEYQLFFDERSLDGDLDLDLDGVPVVVDRMSFTIDNPNASSGCACGNSFS
jgi:Fe-S cluster assembly iron-binding protein IscA